MEPQIDELVIAFVGKTGTGKTSTINALFDLRLPTDNAVACTQYVFSIHANKYISDYAPEGGLTLIDTPGLAESQESEHIHLASLRYALPKAKHVVWILQANSRVYRPDQLAIIELSHLFVNKKITIGLNHVDRIGKGDWESEANQPSKHQEMLIVEKCHQVADKLSRLNVTVNDVVPYSACLGYGLDKLRARLFLQQEAADYE